MKRITPEMMGAAMGIPTQAIRVGLQLGKLPFGTAYKQQEKKGRYTYVIFPEAARETIGDAAYQEMMQSAAAEEVNACTGCWNRSVEEAREAAK